MEVMMSNKAYHKVEVNNPCICCDATESDLFLRTRFVQCPGWFDYRRCRQCGLVFNSPASQTSQTLYDKDYFLYQHDNTFIRRRALSQIQRLVLPAAPYASGKRLIELGSGRGHLLDSLQRIGYDVQGLEPSANAVTESHAAFHVPVFEGTAEQYVKAGLPLDFDIALACTVIEHVDTPDIFLDACASVLKPGGILVMDMPNIDSFNARAAGAAWEMYQKYHVYLFNRTTITLLLKRHRFEVIRTFSYGNYLLADQQIRSQKATRQMLLILDSVGLYLMIRSLYRKWRKRRSDASNELPPIRRGEIESLTPYENSDDAKAPLAAEQRGDHLVVIARKINH